MTTSGFFPATASAAEVRLFAFAPTPDPPQLPPLRELARHSHARPHSFPISTFQFPPPKPCTYSTSVLLTFGYSCNYHGSAVRAE